MTVINNFSDNCSDSGVTKILSDNSIIKSLIEYAPLFVGVLNTDRQFIVANYEYLQQFNVQDIDQIIGQRPGDVLAQVHQIGQENKKNCQKEALFCPLMLLCANRAENTFYVVTHKAIFSLLYLMVCDNIKLCILKK